MTGSGGYAIGARRGLEACASPRGTFTVLALDHRQNLRKELDPTDPDSVTYEAMVEFKRAVVRILKLQMLQQLDASRTDRGQSRREKVSEPVESR